jgi:hypothetical protein
MKVTTEPTSYFGKRSQIPAIKVSPSIGGVCSETATAASILAGTESIHWRSVCSCRSDFNRLVTDKLRAAKEVALSVGGLVPRFRTLSSRIPILVETTN